MLCEFLPKEKSRRNYNCINILVHFVKVRSRSAIVHNFHPFLPMEPPLLKKVVGLVAEIYHRLISHTSLSVWEVWVSIYGPVKSDSAIAATHLRSSGQCCLEAKSRRWAPTLVTRFGKHNEDWIFFHLHHLYEIINCTTDMTKAHKLF